MYIPFYTSLHAYLCMYTHIYVYKCVYKCVFGCIESHPTLYLLALYNLASENTKD